MNLTYSAISIISLLHPFLIPSKNLLLHVYSSTLRPLKVCLLNVKNTISDHQHSLLLYFLGTQETIVLTSLPFKGAINSLKFWLMERKR